MNHEWARIKILRSAARAETRRDLITACRALDRLIRAGRYWIPHWYNATHWVTYWDVFGRPAVKPRYALGVAETWWYDREKAADTGINDLLSGRF